jgi:hypothetical protein
MRNHKVKLVSVLLPYFLLTGTLAFTPGCITTQTGQKIPDPVVLQTVAQEAASVGTTFWLQSHPDAGTREQFELARTSLRALVSAGGGDIAALQNALSDLPIKQLSGTNGQVIVSGAVVLIDAAGKELLKLDSKGIYPNYVQPVAQGLLAGLDVALGPPAK